MIVLAFVVAAMLVTGSFVGRRLAEAREESSVEFRAPEREHTVRPGLAGTARRSASVTAHAARGGRVAIMN